MLLLLLLLLLWLSKVHHRPKACWHSYLDILDLGPLCMFLFRPCMILAVIQLQEGITRAATGATHTHTHSKTIQGNDNNSGLDCQNRLPTPQVTGHAQQPQHITLCTSSPGWHTKQAGVARPRQAQVQ